MIPCGSEPARDSVRSDNPVCPPALIPPPPRPNLEPPHKCPTPRCTATPDKEVPCSMSTPSSSRGSLPFDRAPSSFPCATFASPASLCRCARTLPVPPARGLTKGNGRAYVGGKGGGRR